MKKVLATKKLSEETVKFAASLGMELTMMEVIQTSCIPFNPSMLNWAEIDTVVFTSANAVDCYTAAPDNIKHLINKAIFCTGGRTETLLIEKGFKITLSEKNATGLAKKIIEGGKAKSVLHICGNQALDTLKVKLQAEKIKYTELVVYETGNAGQQKPKGNFDAILFFSPSGVTSYFSNNALTANEVIGCIGGTTAEAVYKKSNGNKIVVAKEPTPESMLQNLKKHFR